jgi:hypothetical protein
MCQQKKSSWGFEAAGATGKQREVSIEKRRDHSTLKLMSTLIYFLPFPHREFRVRIAFCLACQSAPTSFPRFQLRRLTRTKIQLDRTTPLQWTSGIARPAACQCGTPA